MQVIHVNEDQVTMIEEEVTHLTTTVREHAATRKRLQHVDFFVLDNSIRESTVGALRGHTLENKWKIYNEVKKCGFKHIVVAAFSHMTRVDDYFIRELMDKGEDVSTLYSFVELTSGVKNGVMDTETNPVAMTKMKELGLRNPIIEISLANKTVDWEGKFPVKDLCRLLLKRIEWIHQHLSSEAYIFVNLRDFPIAMTEAPKRVLEVVDYISSLPSQVRPFGLMFEDATGKFLPHEISTWTESVRRIMTSRGWESGKLLAHIHKKWGLSEMVQLECIASGADGVWASLCEEGVALGHACSTITMMNLVRLGNKSILQKYNCLYLRTAARNVTEVTSGAKPHPKQVIYGDRALDLVFDLSNIAGGKHSGDFDLAEFFGEKPPVRITTLATTTLIHERLVTLFGEHSQFTEEIAQRMKEVMIEDLKNNRKEEYMSEAGIAVLFDRSGGALTEYMRDIIVNMKVNSQYGQVLLAQVREIWDKWDLKDEVQGDEALEYDSFYNGFMAPYFGCFRCEDTRKGLSALDMDNDGLIDWSDFLIYLKWALNQYPDIDNVEELLSVTFRKGIIPAMQDELLKTCTKD